ncbi:MULTISPECIES: hypothetical protein [unclassified Moorena]|nr:MULTISPECIES: hypothetical protein [unclassified Moorena]
MRSKSKLAGIYSSSHSHEIQKIFSRLPTPDSRLPLTHNLCNSPN